MADPSVSPEPVLHVAAGLWAAATLKSGIELGLFDALAAGPQDVATLSQALGAAPQSLRVVLDALVALGFIDRQAQGYTQTEVSAAFLVSSQPTYLGALVADNANSAAVFDLCKDYRRVVTEGYRLDPWAYSAGANERVVQLTRNLFTLGYPAAQAIADHLGWRPGTPTALRLLEVGCGSAVYGLVALTRLPQARLTAQDWPVVLPVAQEYAAQLGVAARMQTLSGDLRTVAFGGPYDVVFLGHILHNYPQETCREIVRKCLDVLAPGGCAIIVEFLAEPGKPESTFSWLFSVMIHGTRGGRSFSSAEIRQLLTECGASRTEVGGGLPVGFVVGYRR
jgi:2-polyprenyl-3-methyl-5-hydroxy-6-metoxy-1,4-benzoquinol methylase